MCIAFWIDGWTGKDGEDHAPNGDLPGFSRADFRVLVEDDEQVMKRYGLFSSLHHGGNDEDIQRLLEEKRNQI